MVGPMAGPMPQHQGMGGDGVALQQQQHQQPQQQQQPAEEVNAVCAEPKVFVGSLRFEVTQEEVQTHYSHYGPLRSAELLKHMDTGKSKGCAMVLFERWTDAEAAVNAENGSQTQLSAPRTAVVKFADPQRNEHGALCGVTPRKLFIGQVGVARGGGLGDSFAGERLPLVCACAARGTAAAVPLLCVAICRRQRAHAGVWQCRVTAAYSVWRRRLAAPAWQRRVASFGVTASWRVGAALAVYRVAWRGVAWFGVAWRGVA